jgi:uncharacterized protein
MRGAGGTPGGVGQFFLGLGMLVGGVYLLLQSIRVRSSFSFGLGLYDFGGLSVTTGMVMLPFAIGVGLVFYDARSWLGWLLSGGSLLALIVGVIASIHFRMQSMSAFDLIVILVLAVGGAGLLLRSLRAVD